MINTYLTKFLLLYIVCDNFIFCIISIVLDSIIFLVIFSNKFYFCIFCFHLNFGKILVIVLCVFVTLFFLYVYIDFII